MKPYVNPYTDIAFKRLFGQASTTDILLDFLNALLPIETPITSLTLASTEIVRDFTLQRGILFDIRCTDAHDATFIVEMQRLREEYFFDRSVFYASSAIRSQLNKGSGDFRLKPVFFLAIMDFLLDEPELRRDAIQEISLRNKEGFEAYKKLRFLFVQMPLFTKNLDELASRRDEWLYTLRELPKLEQMPAPLKQEPIFRKFFDIAAEANMTPAEYAVYEKELNDRRIENGVRNALISDARKEGLAKGRAEGKAKGRAEGRAEGEAKGRAEGEAKGRAEGEAKGRAEGEAKGKAEGRAEGVMEGKREMARALKANGMSIADIARLSGLSQDEVTDSLKKK
jgi:predicted transposase/invertase (TIGR01784 family)